MIKYWWILIPLAAFLGYALKSYRTYPKDLSKATELFKKSSELGSSEGRDNLAALISPAGSLPSTKNDQAIKPDNIQPQVRDSSSATQQNVVQIDVAKESQDSIFFTPYFLNAILCGILLCLCILIYLIAKVLPKYLQVKASQIETSTKSRIEKVLGEEDIEAIRKAIIKEISSIDRSQASLTKEVLKDSPSSAMVAAQSITKNIGEKINNVGKNIKENISVASASLGRQKGMSAILAKVTSKQLILVFVSLTIVSLGAYLFFGKGKQQIVIFEGNSINVESGWDVYVRQQCRSKYPQKLSRYVKEGWKVVSSSNKSYGVQQGTCNGTEYILEK